MKHKIRLVFVFLLSVCCLTASAGEDRYPFNDTAKQQRFELLTHELRCLVCQNQNLAESNAKLAVDLRNKVYDFVQEGQSKQDIVDYMVARYGDFILFNPPVKQTTYVLWFGPGLFLCGALAGLFWQIRRRYQVTPEATQHSKQRQRIVEESHDD